MSETSFEGLNDKLFQAISPRARVLEFGCATGRLGAHYKALNPRTVWNGVEIHEPSARAAAARLDRVWHADAAAAEPGTFGYGYDGFVMGDFLECLADPGALLRGLHALATDDAQIVCCVPNMTHVSVLMRMLIGDIAYDENGLLDRSHLRFLSQPSLFKIFLDSGWLPDLHDTYAVPGPPEDIATITQQMRRLGVSNETAERYLTTYQMIVSCVRAPIAPLARPVRLSVVVPVNNELQFSLNAARSPGLQEIDAQIVAVRGATSAADAFEQGRHRAVGDWILFCHQDVYLPTGSGFALSAALSDLDGPTARCALLGFAGLGAINPVDPYDAPHQAGLIIDRAHRLDWPGTEAAVSLDELGVVMHRETPLRIDPALGWHLWATDLCLQAIAAERAMPRRVVRIPVFHNSLSDYGLPPAFHDSVRTLLAKYPSMRQFESLCGRFGENVLV